MSTRSPVLIAAAALLAAACSKPEPPPQKPRPVVVEAPQPLTGIGGLEVFPGAVHAETEADLSFRVPGKIAERKVDMGARVKAGTVLAVLDPEDAQLNLQAAQAAVAAAEADLWLAQEEEKRYRELKTRGHVGQSLVDTRINTTKLAQARLDQARSQLDLARNQSSYTRLKADAAGVVTHIMAEPGNVVNAGQPVVRFAADGTREVWITVPEARVEAIRKAGQLAVELFDAPGKRYEGRLRDINPQANASTRTHEARVTIVGGEQLQLGASATVVLVSAAPERTYRLPATALGPDAKTKPAVWTVVPGADGSNTVKTVPVQVLQYLHDAVIVTADLKPEDRLVTAGVHLLNEGMAVEPIDRAAKAAL